jgi:hypothetical protein
MLARRNLQPTSGKSWFTTRGSSRACRCPPSPAASARITARSCRCWMRRFASSITRSPSAGETIRACTGCVRSPASAPSSPRCWSSNWATSPALLTQTDGQLHRPDAASPRQCGSHPDGPYHQGGQPAPPLGPGPRRHAGRPPARAVADVVPRREARRGRNVARVALARRLAELVYHVWKQECDYFTAIHHGVVRG